MPRSSRARPTAALLAVATLLAATPVLADTAAAAPASSMPAAPAPPAPAAPSGGATAELTVLNGVTKAPIPGLAVRLAAFPAGGGPPLSFEGTTDSSGHAQFVLASVAAGSAVLATADFSGVRFHTLPAAAPAAGALPLALDVYEPTTSPEGLTIAATSRVGLHPYEQPVKDFSEETTVMVRVTVELVVDNPTGRAYFPPGNALVFPLPPGALEPTTPDNAFWMDVDTSSARYRDYLAPGQSTIAYEFSLPPNGGEVALDLNLPFATSGLELVTVLVRPGVDLEGTGFGDAAPATVSGRDGSVPVLRAVAGPIAAGTPVHMALTGISTETQTAGWAAVGFGALSVLGCLALVMLGGARGSAVRPEAALRVRRERLLDDLCRVEEGRLEGKMQPERYQSVRADLVSRIAALDRQIEA
ncbi:MAG TPA: Ig-like domain-containing protein [Myxococcota bacterium]|jgi:hypothetical protein|nr:Ig-like domain-containing protein [Myxococcota bacterium]